jgi:hypothetical protein
VTDNRTLPLAFPGAVRYSRGCAVVCRPDRFPINLRRRGSLCSRSTSGSLFKTLATSKRSAASSPRRRAFPVRSRVVNVSRSTTRTRGRDPVPPLRALDDQGSLGSSPRRQGVSGSLQAARSTARRTRRAHLDAGDIAGVDPRTSARAALVLLRPEGGVLGRRSSRAELLSPFEALDELGLDDFPQSISR